MDMKRIGEYLAALRKEHHMTQEQLGERIGVTNKTVSRWETGTYLPPVDALEQLSALYGITINEIISGRPLGEKEYEEAAEENIKSALSSSAFTLQDRVAYFKKKWKKEHALSTAFMCLVISGFFMAGFVLDSSRLCIVGGLLLAVLPVVRYNQMMRYVELRAYDGSKK